MVRALARLGVAIQVDESHCRATVQGCGRPWPEGEGDLYCGNAGTVIRFLAAACAAGHGEYRLDGGPRMRQRPIGQLVEALRDLGAQIAYDGQEGCCPIAIAASGLRGGEVRFSRPASSQFVSALLLAGPLAGRDVLIDASSGMPSAPYVAMTLSVMRAFGVDAAGDGSHRFIVPAPQTYSAVDFEIEPDATAASYFFAAAALTGGRITIEGLGGESCQGDLRFVDLLRRMGCQIEQATRRTAVHGPVDGRLCGVDVDLNDMPDVAPTLAVLAAFAEGPTRIRNVANLRFKETDRLHAISRELAKLGVETEIHDDGLSVFPSRPPVAALIDTYDDHRMAMSFALAGLRLDGVVIRDAACVSKTFPDFFTRWAELAE
jgi:3-phosphoshikimate 1-carboxyvinyltransferase